MRSFIHILLSSLALSVAACSLLAQAPSPIVANNNYVDEIDLHGHNWLTLLFVSCLHPERSEGPPQSVFVEVPVHA